MPTSTVATANLGFPRIGAHRELKFALERYWRGESDLSDLEETGRRLRERHWRLQSELGIDHIPSNDFSFYDHVLDIACLVGAIPGRFAAAAERESPLELRFAMARGGSGAAPLEMTKWFDTNYHFLVPELSRSTRFHVAADKPVAEYLEARALGIQTRPVLLGPVTFLLLSKTQGCDALTLMDRLLPVYVQLLRRLAEAGAEWVQMDEPCLALERTPAELAAYATAYRALAAAHPGLKLMLTTFFAPLGRQLATALSLPVAGLHVDLARRPAQLDALMAARIRSDLVLSLGIVDGRNVWKTDLAAVLVGLEQAANALGRERLIIAPSCSLLHVPVDLDLEPSFEAELTDWLAFGRQKLQEVVALARALAGGREAVGELLAANARSLDRRRRSPRVHDPRVAERLQAPVAAARSSTVAQRRSLQQQALGLPPLPTTTIGSLPQTPELRAARARFRRGELSADAYRALIRARITEAIRLQEALGLDVLVHGEFERSDMVEYFAEQLDGFALTQNGWVQSYGSRCVKPPILFGDVRRPSPLSVEWTTYAQSLTDRPVKGMLTGPVTLLQWSFVRDDQPRAMTCRQLALALRDEVLELEAAGIRIIQIDEPALFEGLPLTRAERPAYLGWAVACFALAASGVRDETQLHTHMCYCDFDEALPALAALDVDVVSLEATRSNWQVLAALAGADCPCAIGPGVYDVHSPSVPEADAIASRLERALACLPVDQLWVNPDCGLKTRTFAEVVPALRNMAAAAERMRSRLDDAPTSLT